jgi:Protein of unknown function (DUF2637)
MTDMGSHSHPNGHRGDDGAAAVLLPPPVIGTAFQPRRIGPLAPFQPPLRDTPAVTPEHAPAAVTEAGREPRDADTVIRLMTAGVVLTVALIAAVVSYSHIFTLGRLHGQDGTAARLLPLSVDGLIAAASLVMLHAARKQLPVPFLSRAMLALGVGATVAANVAYGLPFGWLSAVVSAWPAVAFVGSVEMAVRFVRDARTAATPEAPHAAAGEEAAGDIGGEEKDAPISPEPAPEPQRHRDTEPPSPRRQTSRKPRTGGDKARDILRRNPGLDKDIVAKRAGVTVRTVERAIRELADAAREGRE